MTNTDQTPLERWKAEHGVFCMQWGTKLMHTWIASTEKEMGIGSTPEKACADLARNLGIRFEI